MQESGRILIIVGVILVFCGIILLYGSKFEIGRLPGDFVFNFANIRIYIPLATCLLISLVLSLLLRFFRK